MFIRYPNTQWAVDAGKQFEETKAMLESLGREVKFEVSPNNGGKSPSTCFKMRAPYSINSNIKRRPELYLAVLNRFPETDDSVAALGDLATCYIETENDLYADVVILYLAERFSGQRRYVTQAGNLVLNFAKMYQIAGAKTGKRKSTKSISTIFRIIPWLRGCSSRSASGALRRTILRGAFAYYKRVVEEHAQSPVSYDAMSKIAVCYAKADDKAEEIRTLTALTQRFIKDNRLGHDLIRSLYRLGTAFRQLGDRYYPSAVKYYSEIIKRLDENRDAYQANSGEAEKNQEILEAAIYFKAYCYSKAKPPEGKPEDLYKKVALRTFSELAQKYPKSKLAPAGTEPGRAHCGRFSVRPRRRRRLSRA